MTEGAANGGEPGAAAHAGAPRLHEHEVFSESIRDFAEGATALTAASLRLQMMMLEQMREMLGDLSAMTTDAMNRESDDD